MRHMTFAAALIVALSLPMAAQTLDAQLQKAIQTETVRGDLKAAIEQYRRIVNTAGTANRRIAAQALVRMAECHRKLGDAEAAKIYERIVREYGDQAEAAAEARTRLAAMRTAPRKSNARSVHQIWAGDAVDPMGAPSADGRVLSYTDWNTGDLGVRDLATDRNRRLTNTGGWELSSDFAEFSVPSPDGRDIAYAWYNDKPPYGPAYDLRVISTAGSQSAKPRILHASKDLRWVAPGAWTPDGKSIVFVREFKTRTHDLAVVTLATGDVRVLTALPSPSQRVSVSPDGRYVAFDQHPPKAPNSRDIFVMPIQGGAATAIAPNPANDEMPLWSADGSHLLFVSARTGLKALWAVPMQSGRSAGAPVLIKEDAGTFYPLAVTRSGALYYFEGGSRDNAYVATLDGGKVSGAPVAVTDAYVNANGSAAWSPDGSAIAYYSYRGFRDGSGTTLVVRRNGENQDLQIPLTTHVPRGNAPAVRWFPDGKSVLISGRTEDGLGTLYVRVDLATGREQAVHRSPTSRGAGQNAAVLSADGRALFFIEQEAWEQQRVLKRVDLDTGAVTVVEKGWINSVALSPDGQRLAYIGTTESAQSRTSELRVMPAAGGPARTIFSAAWFDNTRFNTLSWSPDGRQLLFVRPEEDAAVQALWRIPAEGGDPQRTGVSVRGRLKHPHLHPDGRRLLFTTREFSDAAIWVLENFLPAASTRR